MCRNGWHSSEGPFYTSVFSPFGIFIHRLTSQRETNHLTKTFGLICIRWDNCASLLFLLQNKKFDRFYLHVICHSHWKTFFQKNSKNVNPLRLPHTICVHKCEVKQIVRELLCYLFLFFPITRYFMSVQSPSTSKPIIIIYLVFCEYCISVYCIYTDIPLKQIVALWLHGKIHHNHLQ